MASRNDDAWGRPAPSTRPRRVAESIRRELAQPLQRIASDAGLGMLTLSEVDVSPDLRDARLYVTHLGGEISHDEVLRRLHPHLGELRALLGRAVRLRYTPRLSFRFDESVERGARIDSLLHESGATGESAGDRPGTDEDG
ncbi:MAG: 30S ribosome-binding factor RbfA [Gammaproteobacteria bacterium]|nr:30S ribosome-binding factor RbfA [Gammaproteobacteria bacterium]MCG3143716.1 Ribosome-binding factor A [Gammaproteobacteria bacterium]